MTNLDTCMTLTLLACPNLLYYPRIFLLRLTKCIGLLFPIVINAYKVFTHPTLAMLVYMVFPDVVKSSMNRFWSFFACAIGTSSCINSMDRSVL